MDNGYIEQLLGDVRLHDGNINEITEQILATYGSDAVELLISSFNTEKFFLCLNIAQILGKLGSLAFELLLDKLSQFNLDPKLQRCYINALGYTKLQEAIDPLVNILYNGSENEFSIIGALSTIGDSRVVEPIIHCLTNPYLTVRAAAMAALAELKSPIAFESMLQTFLAAKGTTYYSLFARELGKAGDKRAYDFLLQALEEETDVSTGQHLVLALGFLKDERALTPLIKILENRHSEDWQKYRYQVLYALGWIGANAALDTLMEAALDEDGEMRAIAVRSLGELGDVRALQLLEWIKDNDDYVSWGERMEEPYPLEELATIAIKKINQKTLITNN